MRHFMVLIVAEQDKKYIGSEKYMAKKILLLS